ncbi:MAG: hypothetical protein ABI690_02770 [Chloroflexota bacterium]
MADQNGIKTLLDKLKQQLSGNQTAPNATSNHNERPPTVFNESAAEEYVGPPLEIGNELLITAEIVKLYRGLSNALGRVVIIDEIPTNGDKAIKASAFGIQVSVDKMMAQHMRAAYIHREQAS